MNIKYVVAILLFVLSACNEIKHSGKSPEIYELIPYRKGDLWGFCDTNKKIIIPCIYEDGMNYSDDLIAVKHKGKWGFIDKTGKIIVPYKYEFAFCYPNGLALVKGRRFLFIDTTGKENIPCVYDQVDKDSIKCNDYINILQSDYSISLLTNGQIRKFGFSENRIPVRFNGKWGFINNDGKLTILCIYDNVLEFSEGLVAVKSNNKWGFINQDGKLIIPFIYQKVSSFSNGFSIIKQNGRIGVIDTNNNIIIPIKYEGAESLNNFLFKVYDRKKLKLFTNKGIEVLKNYSFEEIERYQDTLLKAITKDWSKIIIDGKGKNIITEFERKEFLFDDIDKEYKDKTFGWINRFGQTIVPYYIGDKSVLSKSFTEDCIKNPKGIMDRKGSSVHIVKFDDKYQTYDFYYFKKIIKPDRYIHFWKNSFIENERCVQIIHKSKYPDNKNDIFAIIYKNEKYGYTNCLGNEIVPCAYDDVSNFYNGFAFVESDLRYKIIDRKGKFISDKEFEYVKEFSNSGYSLVKYKGKWGFIDKKGTEYWE